MNRLLARLLLPLTLASLPAFSWAHNDHGHGHHHHHRKSHKEAYWDGQCKVERKWKKNGEYKEKRKCRDQPVVYQQQPVYVQQHPPIAVQRPDAIVISPQIVIRP